MEIIKSVSKNIQLSKDLSPGAQRASLHPELSQGVLKVNSYSSTCLSIEAGAFVVQSLAMLLVSANLQLTRANNFLVYDYLKLQFVCPGFGFFFTNSDNLEHGRGSDWSKTRLLGRAQLSTHTQISVFPQQGSSGISKAKADNRIHPKLGFYQVDFCKKHQRV